MKQLVAAYPEASNVGDKNGDLPLNHARTNNTSARASIVKVIEGVMEAVRAQAEVELLALCGEGSSTPNLSKKKRKSKKKSACSSELMSRRKEEGEKQVEVPGAIQGLVASPAAGSALCPAVGESDQTEPRAAPQHGADGVLVAAVQFGDLERLTAALEVHAASASEAVLREAKSARRDIKEKQRKYRRKVERVNMCMLAVQQAMEAGTDTTGLADAIQAAEALLQSAAAAGSGLAELVERARHRLETALVEQHTAQKVAAIESVEDEFVALALSRGTTADATASAEDPDKLCVVCMDEPKAFLFTPCECCGAFCGMLNCVCSAGGHMCVCSDCADLVLAGKTRCPICRQTSQSKMRVYI